MPHLSSSNISTMTALDTHQHITHHCDEEPTYALPNTNHRGHQHPTQSLTKHQTTRPQFKPSHQNRHGEHNGQKTNSPHHKTPNFKKHLIHNTSQNFPQHLIQQNQGFTTAPTPKLAVIRPKRNAKIKKKIRSRVNTTMFEDTPASTIGPPISANQKLNFLLKTRRKSTDCYLRNIHAMIFDVVRPISYQEIST
jgi:hypothetical protein